MGRGRGGRPLPAPPQGRRLVAPHEADPYERPGRARHRRRGVAQNCRLMEEDGPMNDADWSSCADPEKLAEAAPLPWADPAAARRFAAAALREVRHLLPA